VEVACTFFEFIKQIDFAGKTNVVMLGLAVLRQRRTVERA